MRTRFLMLVIIGMALSSLGFDGNTIESVWEAVRFSFTHGKRIDPIETLAKHEEWKGLSRCGIISNLVESAIYFEEVGIHNTAKSALNLLRFQSCKESADRLYFYVADRTNVMNRASWIAVSFSMMGPEFAPEIEARCKKREWELSERRAVYDIARQMLQSNGASSRIVKRTPEERSQMAKALLSILPYEENDQAFLELDWVLINHSPGWAFSASHFGLLEQRASAYQGKDQNPYVRTISTLKRRMDAGDTNIVFSADLPVWEPKPELRIRQ